MGMATPRNAGIRGFYEKKALRLKWQIGKINRVKAAMLIQIRLQVQARYGGTIFVAYARSAHVGYSQITLIAPWLAFFSPGTPIL